MKIALIDTNVFLDMLSVDSLPQIFELNLKITTVDFVLSEINQKDQADQLNYFVKSKKLEVYRFSPDDIADIINMKTKRNLRRITDKSVLWKALNIQCLLLTGDKNLRIEAEENGLEVRGSLWVISQLQKANILSNNSAILLLEKLKLQNQSLPKNEIDRLIFMYHDNS